MTKILDNYRVRLFTYSNSYVLNNPNILYDKYKERLINFNKYLNREIVKKIDDVKANLNNLTSRIILLNPMETLKRGYAIVRIEDNVISSISNIKKDDKIFVELKDGKIETKVVKVCE